MGRIDVMKSLLRSAAQATSESLKTSPLMDRVKQGMAELSPLQSVVKDRQLSQAVGRLPAVQATTVRIQPHGILVQYETERSSNQAVSLMPTAVHFAPRGAKEISFTVYPEQALAESCTVDICAAIATELGRVLWRPILLGEAQGSHQAFVHRSGNELTADLKTIPEVRSACGNPLKANVIDALQLADVVLGEGQLTLQLAMPMPMP